MLAIPDVSIVICTYNPDERALTRCLAAVKNLKRGNLKTECLLVDNNSNKPISQLDSVKSFFSGMS